LLKIYQFSNWEFLGSYRAPGPPLAMLMAPCDISLKCTYSITYCDALLISLLSYLLIYLLMPEEIILKIITSKATRGKNAVIYFGDIHIRSHILPALRNCFEAWKIGWKSWQKQYRPNHSAFNSAAYRDIIQHQLTLLYRLHCQISSWPIGLLYT